FDDRITRRIRQCYRTLGRRPRADIARYARRVAQGHRCIDELRRRIDGRIRIRSLVIAAAPRSPQDSRPHDAHYDSREPSAHPVLLEGEHTANAPLFTTETGGCQFTTSETCGVSTHVPGC